ncbi:hypothetical protein [Deminuibacter soli]|uniref:Uncharacterized protein n=1 Tax=Deminuibacter soli TaxID=2291815 RepID=A0A3E1NMH6_9BACT|nr:hypothetical protein [Deminuibacter soli]RFM29111.1 hypothetical protein DXN05_10185 [Deminuibacter soli]
MPNDYFMPRTEADKDSWLKNFAAKLPAYAAKYGITADEVTDMQNSSAYYSYWLTYHQQFSEFTKKLTQYKAELREGGANNDVAIMPAPPTIAAAPTAVTPGIFKCAAALVAGIKAKTIYSASDGTDLGIEGSGAVESLSRKQVESKPTITLRLIAGGAPEIVWRKGGMDGIDIYVDRGTGQWQYLATDTHPNYTDTAPLPAAGQSALWKYRCIYRDHDAQVGQWSDVASITVSSAI